MTVLTQGFIPHTYYILVIVQVFSICLWLGIPYRTVQNRKFLQIILFWNPSIQQPFDCTRHSTGDSKVLSLPPWTFSSVWMWVMNKEHRGYKNIHNKIDRVSGTNHQRDELLPLLVWKDLLWNWHLSYWVKRNQVSESQKTSLWHRKLHAQSPWGRK